MDDWTRVLLYGTFDGFTYSTDDFPRTVVVLDSGERVEVPEECVVSADRMINKNKIKLKDVIARIKELDLGTQKVWLNEILNELGSDYGTLKYKDGYEQGKLEGTVEREKVVVPQFVADWYEENKDDFETKLFNEIDLLSRDLEDDKLSEFEEWVLDKHTAPFQTLVNMHQFGYTVEKEKRYVVSLKNGQPLVKSQSGSALYFSQDITAGNYKVTLKELEETSLGDVFCSPLFEVEEVTE